MTSRPNRSRHTETAAHEEAWRSIPGYEGFSVSSFGGIRREPGIDHAGRNWAGKILATHPNHDGYPRVGLRSGGKQKNFRVHRLVLLAFVGPCPEGMEARHGDNDTGNCRLDNLCWGTKAQNEKDKPRRDAVQKGRLRERDVIHIRQMRQAGASFRKISAATGIHRSHVSRICERKAWAHI